MAWKHNGFFFYPNFPAFGVISFSPALAYSSQVPTLHHQYNGHFELVAREQREAFKTL